MCNSVFAVLAGCLVVQADSPKSDLKKLEGSWVLVSSENEGKKLSDEKTKASNLVIKGDKYTVKLGDDAFTGTLKLDASKTPKTIDSMRASGETLQGIYELTGDEFKLCLAPSGKERPKDFTSGGMLHVWKRARKAAAAPAPAANPPTGTIEAVVTIDGRPAAEGKVLFHPEKGKPVVAEIKNGAFAAVGVPFGMYRVTIQTEGAARRYLLPNTTPLRINVSRQILELRLALSSARGPGCP